MKNMLCSLIAFAFAPHYAAPKGGGKTDTAEAGPPKPFAPKEGMLVRIKVGDFGSGVVVKAKNKHFQGNHPETGPGKRVQLIDVDVASTVNKKGVVVLRDGQDAPDVREFRVDSLAPMPEEQ